MLPIATSISRHLCNSRRVSDGLCTQVDAKDDALIEAFNCLGQALVEHDNLSKLSMGAAAGVQFGVDQEDALRKLLALQERIEFMHEVRFANASMFQITGSQRLPRLSVPA